jgi:hypothetical protein
MRIDELEIEGLTPARLWSAMDPETRLAAAQSMYDDKDGRREADAAVAATLRFRDVAVKSMPVERRVDYLLRAVRPDDGLASSLLIALHLRRRTALLTTFLDALEVPNAAGVIDPDFDMPTLDVERLGGPVATLFEHFAAEDVELYLACLLAMDPDVWSGLAGILAGRRTGA